MRVDVMGDEDGFPNWELICEFVTEHLIPSFKTGPDNRLLGVYLGGSHSKGLTNSRSDVDLRMYYTTTAKNLLIFQRNTVTTQPTDFKQVREHPTTYEWKGMLWEIDTIPIRRVGIGGNDLFNNLRKGNMKTIHDLIKDYPIYSSQDMDAITAAIAGPDFTFSLKSTVGYFQGYMVSQLMKHKRHKDHTRRMRQAGEQRSATPVVKAMMNGIYIGLSGVALLQDKEIWRDFWGLFEKWGWWFGRPVPGGKYVDTDTAKMAGPIWEYIYDCYLYKTDRDHLRIGGLDWFLMRTDRYREPLFIKMKGLFDACAFGAEARGFAVGRKGHKQNVRILDRLQFNLLGLE